LLEDVLLASPKQHNLGRNREPAAKDVFAPELAENT
jgi:hypothetical protein